MTSFRQRLVLLLSFLFATQSQCLGDTVYTQDFSLRNSGTELPAGWGLGPAAHIPYFSYSLDFVDYGKAAPAARIDLPLETLNYRLASPRIHLSRMDQDYTLEFALKLNQPDAPFVVEIVYMDTSGGWYRAERLLTLVGENADSLRVYRISFNPEIKPEPGICWITFGLSYQKLLRSGSFQLDDFTIREGREAGMLAFYLSEESLATSDKLGLHISSAANEVSVQIWREAEVAVSVHGPVTVDNLREEPIPPKAWRVGCNWPVSYTLPIPEDWPSGVYTVKIDDGNQKVWDNFVVRGTGTEGKLLVVLPSHTEQAYNRWGGGSFYGRTQRPEVSFDRPDAHGYLGLYQVPIHLIRWLHRSGIDFAVANDTDLHSRPELLQSYSGIALTWHSEYWTWEMRNNVEEYIRSGGSLLSFSGNTCWWQTRLVESDDPTEPGPGRRLVCYKYTADKDPYHAIDPSRVTTHWDEPPVSNPATRFLNLSWRFGGMVNWSTSSLCPCEYDWLDGHGGFRAYRTDHWVYEGTALSEGDRFGQRYAVVGYEVDGAPIEWRDGRPFLVPIEADSNVAEVLGYAPCWNNYTQDKPGQALVTIKESGSSFVFNGGTTGWCWGLANDSVVQRITSNLIARLPDSLPNTTQPVRCGAYPNPTSERVRLEFEGSPLPESLEFYSVTGRKVASTTVRDLGEGRGVASWDFRDNLGRDLPTGVYLARGNVGPTTKLTYSK